MAATALPLPTRSSAPASPPRWVLLPTPPDAWAEHLRACGGGFFQSPAVLDVSLPPGRPVYARLEAEGRVAAVAVGVRTHCRLSLRARHVRFAALPACAPGGAAAGAASALAALLARRGAAEVAMESFGLSAAGEAPPGSAPTRPRDEHAVPLEGGEEALLARMSRTHRRHANRGVREGWTLRVLRGPEAVEALHAVQRRAAERARARGDGFEAAPPPAAVGRPGGRDEPWGLATFAAFAGDEPLTVLVVGWGGERATYLLGGSTAEGYRRSSAAWLHWRVMADLAARGFAEYELGGTPHGAAGDGHPAHGLYAFKTGFGGRTVACRGLRWQAGPGHLRLHRLAALLTRGAP